MDGSVWLWIGTIGMALGFLAIAFQSTARTEEEANASVVHALVPAVAATLYLLMALGQGAVTLEGTRLFYYARYIDWSITTPLLLLGLAFTALGTIRGRGALVGALLLSDVFMILTGAFAAASPTASAAKWIWYIVSCGFFLAVLYVIWVPLAQAAKARMVEKAVIFRRNAAILSVLWVLYPIVFLLGQDGANLAAPTLVIAAFVILDLVSKVGYGLLALREHKTAR